MNNKILKTTFLSVIILLIISVSIQKNFLCITGSIIDILYDTNSFKIEDIAKTDNSVKGITIENGLCISNTADSQIYIDPQKLGLNYKIDNVSLYISELTDESQQAEVYYYTKEGVVCDSNFPIIHNGENIIKNEIQAPVVRVDVTTKKDVSFRIDDITINNRVYLIQQLENDISRVSRSFFCLLLILAVIYLARSIKNLKNFNNKNALSYVVIILIITNIFMSVFLLNPFNICGDLLGYLNIEHSVTSYQFMNYFPNTGFKTETDGSITSINTDPWIMLDIERFDMDYYDVKTINVITNDISIQDNYAEIYYINNKGIAVKSDIVPLIKGNNSIKLIRGLNNICKIRLDLTTNSGVNIKLDKVEINNRDALFDEVSNKVKYIFYYTMLMLLLVLCYKFGSMKPKGSNISLYSAQMWGAVVLFVSILLNIIVLNSILSIVILSISMFMLGRKSNIADKFSISIKDILIIIISFLVPCVFVNFLQVYSVFLFQDTQQHTLISGFMIVWSVITTTSLIKCCNNKENKLYPCDMMVLVFVVFLIVQLISHSIYNGHTDIGEICTYFKYELWDYNFIYSSMIAIFIYFAVLAFGGIRLSAILSIIALIIAIIGNYIKLTYQGTYLKLTDFTLLGELFGIMGGYIGKVGEMLLVAGLVLLILLIIFNIKKIFSFIQISIHKSSWAICIIIIFVIITSNIGCYEDVLMDNYTLREPDNYSEDLMSDIVENYSHTHTQNNIKPDVILVMAESTFDISNLPDIKISGDFAPNIKKYKSADIISPRYGGGTAAVEFEALTGLTNYFFVPDMVAYNTYFSKNVPVNSIATEFNNNGYETIAVHPNRGSFYNRDVVYNDMGFKKFLDIKDFDVSPSDRLNDDYIKDSLFFDKLIELLEQENNPQFIFGITIEGHSPYTNKFDKTNIKIESSKLSDSEKSDMEQYAQCIQDIDNEIGKIIEYISKREKPTLLYIWGDHLPPMSAFNTLGFLNDKYNKYSTPLIAYSNYKDIEISQEYMTPNQIAPQILRDSQIEYSSYFDYIYSLRDELPILHKEFVEDTNNNDLEKYNMIQYDLLFGKKYLINKED